MLTMEQARAQARESFARGKFLPSLSIYPGNVERAIDAEARRILQEHEELERRMAKDHMNVLREAVAEKRGKWTVIYVWNDNGQVCAQHIEADTHYDAFATLARDEEGDIDLIAAVPGWLFIETPCEDSGKACHIDDYPKMEDTND